MARDYISDDALDRYYGSNYYGTDRDYFDGPPEEEPEEDIYQDYDGEYRNWIKPGERGW